MRSIACRTAMVLLILAIRPVATTADPAPEKEPPFDPERLAWQRLELRAKKLFLSARTEIRLRSVSTAEAAGAWVTSPRGRSFEPEADNVLEVAVDSTMAGRRSTVAVHFTPFEGAAVARTKERHGKKAYRKDSRFTDEGTFVLRRAPAGKSENSRPYGEWTKVEEFFYSVSENGCSMGLVSEPTVLLYMISAASLDEDESLEYCVFSDKQTIPVTIAVSGSERIEVDYTETTAAGVSRRTGEIDTWKVALRPLGESEDFELLGLEGSIDFFLEKEHRVPVRIEGKIGGLGRVTIRLAAVELSPRP